MVFPSGGTEWLYVIVDVAEHLLWRYDEVCHLPDGLQGSMVSKQVRAPTFCGECSQSQSPWM